MPDGTLILGWPEVPEKAMSVAWRQQTLLDAATANDVGLWVPWFPFHKGSYEVTSPTTLGGTVALKFSNAAIMPANGYVVTITDSSITPGDLLTIALYSPDFASGQLSASYTVQTSDDTTKIATGLAAALVAAISAELNSPVNAPPSYADYVDSVIPNTITPEQQAAVGAIKVTHSTNTLTIAWHTPIYPPAITTAKSAGATETLTVTQYDDSSGFTPTGLSLTAVGLLTFDIPAMWVKSPLSSYTSGTITGMLYGVSP